MYWGTAGVSEGVLGAREDPFLSFRSAAEAVEPEPRRPALTSTVSPLAERRAGPRWSRAPSALCCPSSPVPCLWGRGCPRGKASGPLGTTLLSRGGLVWAPTRTCAGIPRRGWLSFPVGPGFPGFSIAAGFVS